MGSISGGAFKFDPRRYGLFERYFSLRFLKYSLS